MKENLGLCRHTHAKLWYYAGRVAYTKIDYAGIPAKLANIEHSESYPQVCRHTSMVLECAGTVAY